MLSSLERCIEAGDPIKTKYYFCGKTSSEMYRLLVSVYEISSIDVSNVGRRAK